jgi:hypothetical protein
MKKSIFIFCIIFILILGQSCKNVPNLEAETKALLVLHNEQQKAHIEKNVGLFLNGISSDFIEVNRGKTKQATKEELRQKFQAYFNAVDFVKWDDATPPVFSFSDDATMATSVVDKLVITKPKQGENRLDTMQFAWLAVYKKTNGQWALHRMGSTNR